LLGHAYHADTDVLCYVMTYSCQYKYTKNTDRMHLEDLTHVQCIYGNNWLSNS